ncbi:MAG: phosphoglycerate kinase [Alphaproteobacteria bacterium]|nr:phosphoglycerate kinase [Alphaproteobacteria bacterium]MDG1415016.1 phosphoglycerate kinase [Alphaproteobacteria bacterium]
MTRFLTLNDADVSGKTVLVRADLNVPMADGRVTDATRLDRLVPTLKHLTQRGAKVAVLSHFGRPKGQVVPEMSLEPVAAVLGEVLGATVQFAANCIGSEAQTAIDFLPAGHVLVLENTRFHAGEEANDPGLSQAIAALGDLYVNDAFSAAHRAHASTEGITHHLPAYAGLAMEAELTNLSAALDAPERPVAAIVGGAKVSTKIDVLQHLVSKVDLLVIGGGMANTFLLAAGYKLGKSLVEADLTETAKDILAAAQKSGCTVFLPEDANVAETIDGGDQSYIVTVDTVPDTHMILDYGPLAVESLLERMKSIKTVVWNGPLGAFEFEPFGTATFTLAGTIASATKKGKMVSVAGGGDTVAALARAGVERDLTYVSTAGGAFLEWMEGKTLPGVKALEAAKDRQ